MEENRTGENNMKFLRCHKCGALLRYEHPDKRVEEFGKYYCPNGCWSE